jgi:predicted Holliday junction resolvase-like endonuclease
MACIETAGLIILFFILILVGFQVGKYYANRKWKDKVPKLREDAIKHSRAVLSGQFSEQIAPYLPDFPYNPSEARFIGKPLDFIVFKGMDEKKINEIVFVEVKTGQSKLNNVERSLRNAVQDKKVNWVEYRVKN